MADRRSADPVDQLVRLVFSRMRVKYPLYWPRRIDTPEKRKSERAAWRNALAGASRDQVVDALRNMRRFYAFRPPRVDEFVRLIEVRSHRPVSPFTGEYVEPVVDPEKARAFFESARQILK